MEFRFRILTKEKLMLNYILAGLIIIAWLVLVVMLGWDSVDPVWKNVLTGIELFVVLGSIYWVPFWLIFFK